MFQPKFGHIVALEIITKHTAEDNIKIYDSSLVFHVVLRRVELWLVAVYDMIYLTAIG
jgi:hypothetical protein